MSYSRMSAQRPTECLIEIIIIIIINLRSLCTSLPTIFERNSRWTYVTVFSGWYHMYDSEQRARAESTKSNYN